MGPRKFHRRAALVALAVIALMVLVARMRLLNVPLERDGGEYAYTGQLILDGVPPYKDAYNMKFPGTYGAYALIMAAFGETRVGIHLGQLFVDFTTAGLVLVLVSQLFDTLAGASAAAAFLILTFTLGIQGSSPNAEQFVLPFAVGGLALLVWGEDRDRWWAILAGAAALGMGMIMKQHGAAFIAFGGLWLLAREWRRAPRRWGKLVSRAIGFGGAALIPLAITCIIMAMCGVFSQFKFWAFDYAWQYVGEIPWRVAPLVLWSNFLRIFDNAPVLWLVALAGLALLWYDAAARQRWRFMVGWLIFSFLSICPGFYFRPHYFMLTTPVVAGLFGLTVSFLSRWTASEGGPAENRPLVKDRATKTRKGGPKAEPNAIRGGVVIRYVAVPLALAATLFASIVPQIPMWFEMTPVQVTRAMFGIEPFVAAIQVAKYLKQHTKPTDKIAILGSEPEIPFYAHRRSATGYIYMYPLVENQAYALKMQHQAIREIEKARPKYMVRFSYYFTWGFQPGFHRDILQWFNLYTARHYRVVGAVVLRYPKPTQYIWGPAADILVPARYHNQCIVLYERNDASFNTLHPSDQNAQTRLK